MNYDKYIEYIKNTGGSPKIEWFDDDWSPIGWRVRNDMKFDNIITEYNGKIFLKTEDKRT